MSVARHEEVVRSLQWRYATKGFDPIKKISESDWAALEQSLVLAPSSFGLQPWKFVVVQDLALRKEIRAAAWDQSQVEDASHLVVLCAKEQVVRADVEAFIARTAAVRGVTPESLLGYRDMILGFIASPPPGFELSQWAVRQVYIALGFFLSTAAYLGLDACPMEGFSPQRVTEILGLEKEGFQAVVMAAAGYRSSEDAYATAAKVRFSCEQVMVVR